MELAGLLDEYGEEITLDLQDQWGIWLPSIFDRSDRRYITSGLLLKMIWSMGEDSHFAQALGGSPRKWTQERFYLMDIANSLRSLNWYYVSVNSKHKPKRPEYWEPPAKPANPEDEIDEVDSAAYEADFIAELLAQGNQG